MWRGFCEHLKDCGRNGTLFVYVLAILFTAATLGVYGIVGVIGLGFIGAMWVSSEISAQGNRFDRLGKMPPLSDNDLRVARSKLMSPRSRR
ncbi:MAG: hypothetical protein QOF48_799 [Verrucomicrobiota bacterium]|jgi:hypothetical protein